MVEMEKEGEHLGVPPANLKVLSTKIQKVGVKIKT